MVEYFRTSGKQTWGTVGVIPLKAAMKGEGSQESWQVFKDILQAQEQSSPILRKESKCIRRPAQPRKELTVELHCKKAAYRR